VYPSWYMPGYVGIPPGICPGTSLVGIHLPVHVLPSLLPGIPCTTPTLLGAYSVSVQARV